MKKLIDKFYSYTPFKRVAISILLVLLISGSMASYSFYRLSSEIKWLGNGESSSVRKERRLLILAEKVKEANPFISDEVIDSLKAYDKLEILSNRYTLKIDLYGDKATISNEQLLEIEDTIDKTLKFKLEHCLLFSNTYMNFTRSLALNLQQLRQIVTFLTKYIVFRKNKNANYDVTNVVQSMETLSRLIQTSVPFLIGKMVNVSMNNMNVGVIHELLIADKLSVKEATKILSVLKNSYSTMQNFKQSITNEYVYFQQFRGRVYMKAPFACWLLDTVFGDPSKKYEKYINNDYTKEELLKMMNKEKHLLLMVLMPNFRKAKENTYESVALQTILCQELSDFTGSKEIFKDPYLMSDGLRSIQKDGKKIYYAVGMDKIDNEGQGDDIWMDKATKKNK